MNIAARPSAPTNSAQRLTQILRAISDPARRRILQALKVKTGRLSDKPAGLCASDIEEQIKLSQPTISHHMAVLAQAGLVKAQKKGLWVWYQRDEAALRNFIHLLRKTL